MTTKQIVRLVLGISVPLIFAMVLGLMALSRWLWCVLTDHNVWEPWPPSTAAWMMVACGILSFIPFAISFGD